jgi:hypothetical protein
LPSRNAAAKPAITAVALKVTRRPSANETAAARTQTPAGAANGSRRRASSGSTTSAIAGTANQSDERGPDESPSLRATSIAPSAAAITISRSSPYLRAECLIRLTG